MKDKIIAILEELENEQHNRNGYNVVEVINKLHIVDNQQTKKHIRGKLRSLISIHIYPEFKTAGKENLVYCPLGKNSGRYRLSKYKDMQ